jgi:hypothetical protein
MLKLFANLFSQADDTRSGLPESLVKAAIERAVDGTDPRLRILSGYSKSLRKPVMHAAEHVIDLVDRLPDPIVVDKRALGGDPAFAAVFYSETNMEQIIRRDAALREFCSENPATTDSLSALLVAQPTEKHSFGHAQVGDQVLSDVPRTTLGFSGHHLIAPAIGVQEARRLLKRRAFDYLLSIALLHVTRRKEERDALGQRKALLRAKLDILQRGASFSQHTGARDQVDLQSRLDEVEKLLSGLGSPEDTLPGNLATIAVVLAEAERHFWLEEKVLYLDKLYVLHDESGPGAPRTVFSELHDSEGHHVTVMLVNIPPRQAIGTGAP